MRLSKKRLLFVLFCFVFVFVFVFVLFVCLFFLFFFSFLFFVRYEDLDGPMTQFGTGDAAGTKHSKKKEAKREIDNAKRDRQMSEQMIRASAKSEETLKKCFLCRDNRGKFRQELVIATLVKKKRIFFFLFVYCSLFCSGDFSYLCVIPEKGLHLLHCMIVPIQHITSMCDADALLLREIDNFKVTKKKVAPLLCFAFADCNEGMFDRHVACLSFS